MPNSYPWWQPWWDEGAWSGTTTTSNTVTLTMGYCAVCKRHEAAFNRLWRAFLILCGQVVALLVGVVVLAVGG